MKITSMPKVDDKFVTVKKLFKINDLRDFQIAVLKLCTIIFLLVLAILIL